MRTDWTNEEDEFLKQEFSKIDLLPLGLDFQFEQVITQRLNEIKKSLHSEQNSLCFIYTSPKSCEIKYLKNRYLKI